MADTEVGVYYRPQDGVGFLRRVLIDVVDGVVLLLTWTCILVVINLLFLLSYVSAALAQHMCFWSISGITFAYLVLLKRWGRTLGYLLLGAQLVSIKGTRPSYVSLVIRSLFLFLGPMNTLLDLMWLSADPHRQSIRDKFARTYVIRRGAQPQGQGPIRYMILSMMNYTLIVPEVARTPAENKQPVAAI